MNGLAVCAIISSMIYVFLYNWTYITLYLLFLSAYFLLSHLLTPPSASKCNSASSKYLISRFSDPDGPEIMCSFKVRVNKALEYINKVREKSGKKVTITHLVAKISGTIMPDFPDINGKLAFGLYKPHKTCDVCCLVAIDDGRDLGMITYTECEKKSLMNIVEEAEVKVKSLKTGDEKEKHKKASGIYKFVPSCIGGILLELVAFITVMLGLSIPSVNLKKHPAGGILISNVGEVGVELGYAPMPTFLRCNVLVALSKIKDDIVINDGRVEVEKTMNFMITADHRFSDGTRGAKLENRMKEMIEDPEKYIPFE